MRYLTLLLILTFSTSSFARPLNLDEKFELAKTRCSKRALDEPYFFMNMFKSDSSLSEFDESYKVTYNQTERLFNRAGYLEQSNSFVTSDGENLSVTLPEQFIKSVILHIENALKLNYVKYVFFPDMGHSHIQIPKDYYDEHYKNIPPQKSPLSLNQYLQTPGLKSLYHTAEKLQLTENGKILDDWYIGWRFYTRNLLGDAGGHLSLLTNEESSHNTVSKVPGHRWSFGVSLSANKNGCFPFEDKNGQIQYFDISAWDPPYDCINNFCGKVKSSIF
jgi:hypothetical protein